MKRFLGNITRTSKEENCLARKALQDYTWRELKIIADDLSENDKNSAYYDHMFALLRTDSKKTFETNNNVIGKQARVRIIGILQDEKADGGTAGLTFQFTHALNFSQQMSPKNSNADGWEKSSTREWLNNIVINKLPKELQENIQLTKKYYHPSCDATSSTILDTNDYLWLPSVKEIYALESQFYQWYDAEGTGEYHDEQYAWYAHNKIATKNNSLLENMALTLKGNTPIGNDNDDAWWLRSVAANTARDAGKQFMSVRNNGEPSSNTTINNNSVIPCFSF